MSVSALVRRPAVADAGLALAAFAATLALLGAGGVGDEEGARGLDALGVVLAAAASLPLLARRASPLAAFAVTALASAALAALDYGRGPPIGPTVALYSLGVAPGAARIGTRWTAAVVLGLFAVHVAASGYGAGEFPVVPLLLGALVWGGAWVVGDRVRLRRERIAALEERAVRAEREAERERRLAAAEERTRIARDLHDSAGHAINVILVQAGAARLLREQDPERSHAALEVIEDVARETLREIDRLVGILREDSGHEGQVEVEPPPGLAALDALARRQREAGLAVDVRIDGKRRPLPPAVDHAAYRILQEALTNAGRHGGGSAEVAVAFGRGALDVTVTNPLPAAGEAARPAGGGHGLVGMRERTSLLGGSLDAGSAGGLFRVHARLPYAGARG